MTANTATKALRVASLLVGVTAAGAAIRCAVTASSSTSDATAIGSQPAKPPDATALRAARQCGPGDKPPC